MPSTTIGASGDVKSCDCQAGSSDSFSPSSQQLERDDPSVRRGAVLRELHVAGRARGGREDPAAACVFERRECRSGAGVGELRRHCERRLVIAAAERRRVEQIEAPVVRRGRDQIPVLVANDGRRRVEVGAWGCEPVLRHQRVAIEGDDRVGAGAAVAPVAERDIDRAVSAERQTGGPGDIRGRPSSTTWAFRSLDRHGEIHRPQRVRRRAALAGGGRVDDAVDPDQRRWLRVGRKERHRRLHLRAVADIEAVDDSRRRRRRTADRRGRSQSARDRVHGLAPQRSGAGGPRWASGWLSTAAPLPGSPTALPLRTPPRPPPPTTGAAIASAVRRLGIAIRPPGHATSSMADRRSAPSN